MISNYTNFSEIMNEMLKTMPNVSISDMVNEGTKRKIILQSEGELADTSDLENAFIALVDKLYRSGSIRPDSGGENETNLLRRYESGELAGNGFGGEDGDRFLKIRWAALTDALPVISNL